MIKTSFIMFGKRRNVLHCFKFKCNIRIRKQWILKVEGAHTVCSCGMKMLKQFNMHAFFKKIVRYCVNIADVNFDNLWFRRAFWIIIWVVLYSNAIDLWGCKLHGHTLYIQISKVMDRVIICLFVLQLILIVAFGLNSFTYLSEICVG